MLSTMQMVAQSDPLMLTQVVKKDLANSSAVISEQNYEYNADGLQTRKIQYSYYGGNTYGSKTEWIYDNSTGYLTEEDNFSYDSATSTFSMSFKTEYLQYDSNGNILEEQSSYYDTNNNVWVFNQKVQYHYNAGVLDYLERFYYDTTSSTWQNQSKEIYTYTSGLVTLKLNQQWDSVNSQFIDSGKWHYTYDANNLLIEKRFEYYDTTASAWVDSQKTVNTYDAVTHNRLTREVYQWNIANSAWVGNQKDVFTYDGNGNVSVVESYSFDAANNIWNSYPSNAGTATYDNTVDRSNLGISEDYSGYYNFLFNHKIDLLHITQYDINTAQQEPYQDWEFHYTLLSVLGVSENRELKEVGIYPNPVNNFVNLKGTEKLSDYKLIIYDMQGKQVLYRNGQNKINVQTLPAGNYIYRVIAKEGVKSGVLLKN